MRPTKDSPSAQVLGLIAGSMNAIHPDLAAGLKGIKQEYELPREAAANLFAMTPEELAAEQIRSLPGSLNEAVADMENSELMAETLGEHVFEWFIRNKRAEWASYKTHISQFELDRYLPLL